MSNPINIAWQSQPASDHPDAPLWHLIHRTIRNGSSLADRVRMARYRRVKLEQPLDEIAAMTDEQIAFERAMGEADEIL